MAFPDGPSHEKVYYGVAWAASVSVLGRRRLSAEAWASRRWGVGASAVGASALGRGRLSAESSAGRLSRESV